MEPPKITDEWSGEVADDTDNDYRPARAAFHEDQSVCDYILGMATAAVPFKIAASQIASPGSGLFVTEEVEEGQELFHSQPPFICVFPGESGICHYCLRDAESPIHPEEGRFVSPGDPQILARACMGCNVAKFCSKVGTTGCTTPSLYYDQTDLGYSRIARSEDGGTSTRTNARY